MDSTAQNLLAQLRANPLDPSLLESLRQHCENTGDPSTWAEALEHHARAASAADADPIELGRLHFELGNLYRDQLGRSDRAITHYRAAIDFDAAQRAAITAARAIFAEAGKWDQVAKLLAREADSLPEGPKRAALLREQASVLRDRLHDRAGAIDPLREAAGLSKGDLSLQHELATLLLDHADRTTDRTLAQAQRKEAADVLCEMARRVSDDYAIAYVEAALDAVPDHEPALRLLQTVAPRMGRADSIPARWVASLQHAPEGPMARELRLKLAIAYRTAGQQEDAWQCLKPLVERGDREASDLAEGLPGAGGKKSAPPAAVVEPKSVAPAAVEPKKEESLFALHADDLVEEKTGASEDLSEALDALRAEDDASEPLEDLAGVAEREPHDSDETLVQEPEGDGLVAEADADDVADDFDDDEDDDEGEELTGSGLEEMPEGLRVESTADDALEEDLEEEALEEEEPAQADLASREEPVADEASDRTESEGDEFGELEELASGAFEPERAAVDDELAARAEAEAEAEAAHDEGSEPEPLEASLESASGEATALADDAPALDAEVPEDDDGAGEELDLPSEKTATGSIEQPAVAHFAESPDTDPDGRALLRAAVETSMNAPTEPPPAEARADEQGEAITAASAEQAEDEEHEEVDEDLVEETTQPRADIGREASQRLSAAPVPAPAPAPVKAKPPEPEPEPEPQDELSVLRRELKKKVRFRDRRGAADVAEKMLAMGVLDEDAITALEDHYRMTRDFRRMRDLALRIASELEVPVETRLSRLREAAMLSESKLGDVDGTAHAWREVLALLPTDDEANNKLRRLLTRLSRWDELCQLLDQRAQAEPEPHDRAQRYRELATMQRDKRKSANDAINALEQARKLEPDVASDVVTLCELYVSAQRFEDAVSMYEWRVEHTEEPVERVPLLVTIAELYEQELGNLDAAYTSAETLLQIAPRHLPSLDRLLRIDEKLERWEPVIRGLEAKLPLQDAQGRAKLHARIGEIALTRLNDAAKAADAYASALDIVADDRALLEAAAPAFEQAGRRDELTENIAAAAQHARDAQKRFELYALVAERREADGDVSAAIAAREAQLAVRRDPALLAQLVGLLRRTDRGTDLVRRLDELARVEQPSVARDLRVERAVVLAEQLGNLEAAKGELLRLLEELAPDDVQVLEMLIDLSRRSDDIPHRTQAQERLIKLTPSVEGKVDLATDLADTFEKQGDLDGAIRVLRSWIGFEPGNPQPHLRIAPLYEQTGQKAALRDSYDALATLAMDTDEVGEYLLRAARVALELEDFDGAWNRLVPRVVDAGESNAEELLKEVAKRAGRGEALAELYVGLAQRDEGTSDGPRRWIDAARTYETLVSSNDRALEAVLRAFAKNLDDQQLWAEADRLAGSAKAWGRLHQVYDALVKRAQSTPERVAILMRHAQLLEQTAQDKTAALARATLAFQLDPTRADVYAETRRLAEALSEHEQLIALFERRAQAGLSIEVSLDALLSAGRSAHVALEDTPRATSYLARAVRLAESNEALLETVEERARELDAEHPAPHGRGLVRSLAEVYDREANENARNAELAAQLYRRSSHLLDGVLSDLDGAYAALERASAKKAHDEALLDELVALAARANKQQALAAHLAERAESAIDSATATAALWRLGALYQDTLHAPDSAAETYAQLVKLRPNDLGAHHRLRGALAAAGRNKELLLSLERETSLSSDPATRVALLKETAAVWENALGNRFEAMDTWRKVQALAPEDADAATAIERLKARPKLDDASLLDGEIVVSPEDLRPSMPGDLTPPAAEASEESANVDAAASSEAQDAPLAAPSAQSATEAEGDVDEAAVAAARHTDADAHADADAHHAEEPQPEASESAVSESADADAAAALAGESDEPPTASGADDAPEAQPPERESHVERKLTAQSTDEAPAAEPAATAAEPAEEVTSAGYVSVPSDETPVAGTEVTATLAAQMAAFNGEVGVEGSVSQLEQAAAQASQSEAWEEDVSKDALDLDDHDESSAGSGAHAVRSADKAHADVDETMDLDSLELEDHEDEDELGKPVDLSALSSMVDRVPAASSVRAPAGSRVPPPPPAARPSAPPPPNTATRSIPPAAPSVRPPPPPRRS